MKKLLSISLALMLLFSQMGFAIGTHYCMGMAVETKLMLGHEHLDCGMPEVDKPREKSKESCTHVAQVPCCDNEYSSLTLDEGFEQGISISSLSLDFVVAFIATIIAPSCSSADYSYLDYSPPLVTQDISILHQVFLI